MITRMSQEDLTFKANVSRLYVVQSLVFTLRISFSVASHQHERDLSKNSVERLKDKRKKGNCCEEDVTWPRSLLRFIVKIAFSLKLNQTQHI